MCGGDVFDTVCAQYLVFELTLDSHQLIPKCLPIQEITILYRYTCIPTVKSRL